MSVKALIGRLNMTQIGILQNKGNSPSNAHDMQNIMVDQVKQ